MSVKSFLEVWPFPSGFVMRRVVTVTAYVSAALGAPSMAALVPPAHSTAVAPPSAAATSFSAPLVSADPSLPTAAATPSGTPGPYGVTSASHLTAAGIPPLAYQAYVGAAVTLASTDPSCQLHWSLIAGIGRVESNHGSFNGSQISADGTITPPILGIRLDGTTEGTARIADTDQGRFDGDTEFDRALGPMQFLPGTWKTYGGDADPQNMNAAALGTGRYLCEGDTPLTTDQAKWAAVHRYNHSDSYVSLVMSLAATYATGATTTFPARPAGTAPDSNVPPATAPGPPPAITVPQAPTRKSTNKPVLKKAKKKKSIAGEPTPTPTWAKLPKQALWPSPTEPPAPTAAPTATATEVAPWPTEGPTDEPVVPPSTDPTGEPPAPPVDTAAPQPPATSAPAATTSPAPPAPKPTIPPAPPAPPTPTGVAPTAPGQPTTPSTNRSGLPWQSGFYLPGDNPATVEAFGTWRGRPVDVITTWPARQTWSDITSPTWLYSRWAGTPYTTVFGVPPIPEKDGATLTGCANGDYNYHWARFATTIQTAGLANRSIIRLGWEFNGDWYAWQASDPYAFIACWRQIHTTVEAIAPTLRWDWNLNRGPSQSLADPANAYPGDAYVDYIGVDSYDIWPGVTNEASWQRHYSARYGLKHWADFAAAHGKQLTVPEWGVYPGTQQAGNNGGDNAFYISKMFEFFRSLGPQLAYESYFNETAPYYAGALEQNPKAAAQYIYELQATR